MNDPASNVTVRFDEAVRKASGGFFDAATAAAVTLVKVGDNTDLAVAGQVTISGQVITIDPVSDLESGGQYTVTLLKGQVEDLWGNKLGTAQTATFTVDTDAPTLAIRGMPVQVADWTPFDVAFIFSEVVIGFSADDVTVSNGTLSNLMETTKGTEWSAQVTPRGKGGLKVEVAAGRVTDVAGNTGPTSAVSVFVIYDDAPLVTLHPLRTDDVGAPSVTQVKG